jgi:hypothetical protein
MPAEHCQNWTGMSSKCPMFNKQQYCTALLCPRERLLFAIPGEGTGRHPVISLRSLAGGESQSWQSAFLEDSVSWHGIQPRLSDELRDHEGRLVA